MSEEDLFDNRPLVKKNGINRLPMNPESHLITETLPLGRFPSWLHRKLPIGGALSKTRSILEKNQLNTVCEEAKCPNRIECYSKKTATFLALGKECSRACGFCDIAFSKSPKPPEKDEATRIANSVKDLDLEHVVITMVARDELPDGGANHIASIIKEIKERNKEVSVEVLTSDFNGNLEAIDIVLQENPEIFNHNIETVRRLSPSVRHRATYDRTLSILKYVKSKKPSSFVKSGMMVGLGETKKEVEETLQDLKQTGCDIVTIGHYLQASRSKLSVKSFVTPEEFKAYEEYGYSIGIRRMYCGPFIRSSYNAHLIKDLTKKNERSI